jgi:hypothetical protein
MAKAKKASHCTLRNEKLFCAHCGGEQALPMPMQVEMFTAMCKTFGKLHDKCLPTWKPPEPDQTWTVSRKAEFWYAHGERGLSSKTMYNVLRNGKSATTHHPSDPDDFRRCYLLLRMVPEWKDCLFLMKDVSDVWSNLVDNWDKLSVMLEEQLAGKKNDMYGFMKKLGC